MTTVKNSSVRLFEQVKANGSLYGIALDVFGIVCKTPGLTGGEIFAQYERNKPLEAEGRSRNEIAKRVSDLANWGAIKADGVTICPVSGRKANRWVPTGRTPVAKNERRTASRPEKVTFSGTQAGKTGDSLAGAVQGLGRILGMNVSAKAAEELVGQARTLAAEGFSLNEMKAQVASAKAAEKVAYDSRNAAQARVDMVEEELRRLKASAVSIDGRREGYLLDTARLNNQTPTRVIELALDTYQALNEGRLAPVSSLPKRAPVAPGTVTQLSALARRTRLVLRFKRFLPKSYVKQAEATLAALESAVASL